MKTNNNLSILIVDDEKFNIELAAVYLKEEGYKLFFAMNAEVVMQNISTKKIDLILLDIEMPGKDGFEVCRMLKSETKTKDIPIIFLTSKTDIESISHAFEVGGVDYISKPFNSIELLARVKTHLQNRAYLEEIKQKQLKLAQLTITDPLTKLHNTLFFDSQIKMKLNNKENFWIIYIKINNFGKINNLYGFHASNRILKKFSKLLTDATVTNSIVARLYSINFGILIKDYDKKTILNVVYKLFKNYLKSKDLVKLINYSIAVLHVQEDMSLDSIYKKLQDSNQDLKNSGEQAIFL